MLSKIRNLLYLIGTLSIIVIILAYVTNSEANAPHPDGNLTAIDMSSVYGDMSKFMLLATPYAVVVFFGSLVGILLVSYKIKNY